MATKSRSIQTIYLYLVLGNTLAASFIWGINTIFLLDAGLSNFEAFLANAFFTLGEVLFEIPTGIVADMYGRRVSYLLGALTLGVSTLLYLFMWQIRGPFWGWAASSALLGLGFTFFSGALEAWLVDALQATHFTGNLHDVFSKGQMVGGAAMLVGSAAGGVIAQFTNLGVPYVLRALVLAINFATAFFFMKDLGFTPERSQKAVRNMKKIFTNSIDHGLKNPPVRWVMIAAPFTAGVGFYIFYALQPFLLQLYGDTKAYSVAGLVAAIAALAQIVGGFTSSRMQKVFKKRTTALLLGVSLAGIVLVIVSSVHNFWVALALIFLWGLIGAAVGPFRQSYLNGIIPSQQRATILSFDSLMGSSGGIFIQPALGKVADIWNYPLSYALGGIVQSIALPFILLARREKNKADIIGAHVSENIPLEELGPTPLEQ